jgi:murein DD-endopeptidase MepM/ murein hydrolase activator NlpD
MRTHLLTFVLGVCAGASAARVVMWPRQAPVSATAGSPGSRGSPMIRASDADDTQVLRSRNLTMPIANVKPGDMEDTFEQSRAGGKRHEATDILAPRNTPVLAVDDGVIRKLFLSKPGGITIYEFDREGIYCYYYAHLDHYAEGLKEGARVKRGETIGYVGTTGDAPPNRPHLHFAITKLGPEKNWWQGTAVNPYPILKALMKP